MKTSSGEKDEAREDEMGIGLPYVDEGVDIMGKSDTGVRVMG